MDHDRDPLYSGRKREADTPTADATSRDDVAMEDDPRASEHRSVKTEGDDQLIMGRIATSRTQPAQTQQTERVTIEPFLNWHFRGVTLVPQLVAHRG